MKGVEEVEECEEALRSATDDAEVRCDRLQCSASCMAKVYHCY